MIGSRQSGHLSIIFVPQTMQNVCLSVQGTALPQEGHSLYGSLLNYSSVGVTSNFVHASARSVEVSPTGSLTRPRQRPQGQAYGLVEETLLERRALPSVPLAREMNLQQVKGEVLVRVYQRLVLV